MVLGVMLLVGYDLAGSVSVQTHSQYRWNEDGLLIVTKGVLSQAKKDFQSLIVYIYGDWCLSAQGSVPKFVDLAHQHQVIDTKLVFGVLEVKDQKGLAKLGVKEVPSIIAFKAGTPHLITWNDNPDFDAIAHKLEIIYEDLFIQHFPDSHSLAEYRKNSSVVVFHGKKYSEPHRMTSLFWDFYKTAENHFSHHVTFGHMEPNNESGSQGMISDRIYFCRTGGNPCLKYTRAETNVFELYDWVNSLTDDPLIDIDGVGFDKVYRQQKTALVV